MSVCPKCGGNTYLVEVDSELWSRCICGFSGLVFTSLKISKGKGESTCIKLPKKGSMIRDCLDIVINDGPMYTKDIADKLGISSSSAGTFLYILEREGFIKRVSVRRGVKGGSLWDVSKNLLTVLDDINEGGNDGL